MKGYVKTLSIGKKNIILISVAIFFSLSITTVALVVHAAGQYKTSLVDKIESAAKVIETNSVVAIEFNDKKEGKKIISSLSSLPEVLAAVILDKSNNAFVKYEKAPSLLADLQSISKEGVMFTENRVYLARMIRFKGETMGRMILAASTDQLSVQIRNYIFFSLALTVFALVLTVVIGRKFSNLITDPILSLSEKAVDISRIGDYSIRIHHTRTDEIGILYDGFNEMLGQIEERDDKIRSFAERLENMVHSRTAELEATNLDLKNEITERRKAEAALKISETNYREIFDGANDAVFVHDLETGTILDVNKKACDLFGYTREEMRMRHIEMICSDEPPYAPQDALQWMKKAARGESQIFEWLSKDRFGRLFWMEVNLKKVVIAGTGKLLAVVRDIAERKKADIQIKKNLREKEVLLREIHHRVKNNMQVISSLLKLQADHIKGDNYTEILKESQDRIKSMALVHEKLYQSNDFEEIDFKDYIKSLSISLFRSYGADSEKIKLDIDVADVAVDIERAIPCGLIINELISNSLKYAFPDNSNGRIRVAMCAVEKDMLELNVSDNGIGLPEGLDGNNTNSLGLHLVTILSEGQLHGKIDFAREGGTQYRIRFPRKKDRSRI